jgi:hypothetical protein
MVDRTVLALRWSPPQEPQPLGDAMSKRTRKRRDRKKKAANHGRKPNA